MSPGNSQFIAPFPPVEQKRPKQAYLSQANSDKGLIESLRMDTQVITPEVVIRGY